MRSSLALFADFRRALGTRRALLALPGWLVRREFSVMVSEVSVEPAAPAAEPPAAALEWAPFTAADVPHLVALNPALDAAEVRGWLAAGHDCVLARLDGEPVHFRTYVTGRVDLPYLGRALALDDGDVLLGQAYTAPALRRRGLLAVAAAWSERHVRSRGHRRKVALIARWNEAPRRAAERAGMVEIGRVGVLRLGPWRRWFARGRVRFDAAGDLRLPPRDEPAAAAAGTDAVVA